jgi:hypothetical protein
MGWVRSLNTWEEDCRRTFTGPVSDSVYVAAERMLQDVSRTLYDAYLTSDSTSIDKEKTAEIIN